jgi:hypothetical protein
VGGETPVAPFTVIVDPIGSSSSPRVNGIALFRVEAVCTGPSRMISDEESDGKEGASESIEELVSEDGMSLWCPAGSESEERSI